MGALEKMDLRIKRLTTIEAEYRASLKRAQADLRKDPEHKKKYTRIITKRERKVDKLLPKIRRLRERRAVLRAR